MTLLVAAAAFLAVPEADAQEASLNTSCPTNVRAEGGARLATLGWSCDDTEVTGYEYRVKSPGEGWTEWLDAGGADASSFPVSGLAAGVEHTFQMRARGVKDIVTVPGGARRQFVSTMSVGPYAGNAGDSTNEVIAMPFRTGTGRHGYLMTGARVKFHDFRRDSDPLNDTANDTRTSVVKLRTNDDEGTPSTRDDDPGNQVLATFTLVGDGPMIDMREFRLPSGRELSPNTIYWVTVNEGVPCNNAARLDPTECDAAYVSRASASDKRSRYGWSADPRDDGVFEGRRLTAESTVPFEFDILGYPRVGRRVTAYGPPSAEVSATPGGGGGGSVVPPGSVAAVRAVHNGSSLSVSWDAPARATHYDVTYTADGVHARAAWNRAGTTITITCDSRPEHQGQHCVNAGKSYTVGVRARNDAGESSWTNSREVSPGVDPPTNDPPPGPVSGITANHDGSSLDVSWDAPEGATHYDVTYSSGRANARAGWNRPGTSITITCDSRPGHENQNCVHENVTYTVGVRARNAGGESAWTNSAPLRMPSLIITNTSSARENNTTRAEIRFPLKLGPVSRNVVTVDYATTDGTATAGSDYAQARGTVTFAAGESSKTISVYVLCDSVDEASETFKLRLFNSSATARIAISETEGAIEDDPGINVCQPASLVQDAGPSLPFGRAAPGWALSLSDGADRNVLEGGVYSIRADSALPIVGGAALDLRLDEALSGADGADFSVGRLEIGRGAEHGSAELVVFEDSLPEDHELLVLHAFLDDDLVASIELTVWDAAVPALPAVASAVLAALLCGLGAARSRRDRRRRARD